MTNTPGLWSVTSPFWTPVAARIDISISPSSGRRQKIDGDVVIWLLYTEYTPPKKKHQMLHPLNFSTFSRFRLENWKNQDSPVDLRIECQPKPGGDTEGMDRDELTMMRYSGI